MLPPDMLTLSLPYPPGSNRLWRHERGGHRLSAEAIAWKRQAQWIAQAAGCRLLVGNVAVTLVLHPRLTKAGKASQTRIDVDAPIKLGLDSLQGIAYTDDKQVVAVSCRVGQPCPNGGLTVSVWPANEPGDEYADSP